MDNDQPKGDNDQPNGQTNSTDYTYPYSSHKENNVRDLGLWIKGHTSWQESVFTYSFTNHWSLWSKRSSAVLICSFWITVTACTCDYRDSLSLPHLTNPLKATLDLRLVSPVS